MSGEAAAFDEKLEVPTSDFAEGATTLASDASPNSVVRDATCHMIRAPIEEGHLHINDDSVLPSFDMMVQKDHRFGMEDGGMDSNSHCGPRAEDRDEAEEGRLLNAFSKWQEHRGSSRLRLSNTPNDPEEDPEATSGALDTSEKFVSGMFANTSVSNHSVMNSLALETTVPEGRGNGANYGNPRHRFEDVSSAASLATTDTRTGFNMKQYEEELIKLRNDNFSLKLRIHLLEERQGLALRPGDSDAAKENVFGVNLDLRVEKETLKQQIDEKNKLLAQAAAAIEEMEREKSLVENQLNSQLNLNTALQQQMEAQPDRLHSQNENRGEVDVSQRELLMEAFGSMNLGARTEDAARLTESRNREEADASLRNFEELGKQLEEERVRVVDLQAAVSHKEEEIIDMLRAKEEAEQQVLALKSDHEAQLVELMEENESKHMECVRLRTEFDAKEEQLLMLTSKVAELEECANSNAQSVESQVRQEAANFQQQIANLKTKFMQERTERDEEWRAKCHGLSSSVEAFKKSLAETQENLVKTQLSVSGLTEMNGQLKLDNDDLRSGVETRDEALAILREEYEKLKARYRKKSQQQQNSIRGSTSSVTGDAAGTSPLLPSILENSNKENIASVNKTFNKNDNVFYEDELSLSRKEVDLLKGELRLCKETFMRSGAAKAVEAVESVYRDQMTKVEGHHTKIIAMMRRRLEELADCLQKLLNVNRRISVSPGVGGVDGSFLDVSVMSESLLDASKSFLGGQEDLVNETQLPESVFAFPADQIMKAVDESVVIGGGDDHDTEVSSPGVNLSTSPVTSSKPVMVGKRLKEYENLMTELRESAKKRANAEGQAQVLRLDLEAASREAAEVKSVLAKSDRNSKDLENQLNKAQQRSLDLQNQLADTGANLEGLRIKNGQLKEALAKAQNEVTEAKANTANRSRLQQAEEKTKQVEAQNRLLLDKHAKSQEYIDLLIKEVDSYKEAESLLKSQLEDATASQGDVEDLRQKLAACQEKLAAYKERQEATEKSLKHQLAKTHSVLKKTNKISSKYQDQNRPPLGENA